MIVEDIMKKDVVTLSLSDTIAHAIKLMNENKIRHLPVVNSKNEIIGLVTDRDIREAKPSIFRLDEHKEDLNNPIETIMNTNVITGHPLDFVEETAAVFYEYNIGCLPIVQDGVLVGIITESDLLHTLVQLTGAHQPGSQIEIKVINKVGTLCNIATVIGNRKANILSILIYPDKKDPQTKILALRVQTMNPTGIVKDLQEAGFEVLWPKMPGISL